MSLLKILLLAACLLSALLDAFEIYLLSRPSDYEVVNWMADREIAAAAASIVRLLILAAGIYFL